MSFLQPLMLIALPLIALPIIIHLINQWRYQTRQWGAMMFLLAANRMNRGFARIRQWLILAMRTLAVAGLIFAIARPLSSGLLGISGGGKVDTTIVLLDRSPSMQQVGLGGVSKLDTGRQQLAEALRTLGAQHWVAVDGAGSVHSFETLDAMLDSPEFQSSSATADLPSMVQGTLDYLKANKPGPTEIWICSDLRENDWNAASGTWTLAREGFEALPQTTNINLLAFPDAAEDNLALRVTSARRSESDQDAMTSDELLLSLQISRTGKAPAQPEPRSVAIEIEVDGVRSSLTAEMIGNQLDLQNHRIPLASDQLRGWGKVTIPADSNNADNEYYFVFDDPPLKRVVIVSEDRKSTRAVEIAASLSEDGSDNPAVEVLTPEQLDSLVLDDTSLLVWQTVLPDNSTSAAVTNYVENGGQVIFFPPTSLQTGAGGSGTREFMGVAWNGWNRPIDAQVMVENWRGDQDLLAATLSGVGLPVGQLKLSGYAKLKYSADISKLASLSGGDPLLAKVPTAKGGVYFCTTSASPDASSLAESGIVLFVSIQRAMARGQEALGKTTARTARYGDADTGQWRLISGGEDVISTEFASAAGVYAAGEQMFAINRAVSEDRQDTLPDEKVESLFAGLRFSRVDGTAGNLSGIVREVWRMFLILMIAALLIEALLCIPRRRAATQAAASGAA